MPISRNNGNQPMVGVNTNFPVTGPQDTNIPTTEDINNNLPDLGRNSWEVGFNGGDELSPAVKAKADTAVNHFNTRLRRILGHDAMSLAEGRTPIRDGDSLTEAQKSDLTDAAKDMFMDMPIGALSPQKTNQLRGYLDGQGISTENLETKTLEDLGDIGSDLAKQWADDLKDEKPAVFYGVLGAAGAAIGTYGFLQGSEALKDLGIKPEFKTDLFGDHVKVKAEAMWERRFANPNLAATVEGNYRAGDFRLRSNLTVDTRNLDDVSGGVGVRWGNDSTYLDAEVNGNRNGVDTMTLSGRYTGTNYNLHGTATVNDDFDLQSARIGGSTTWDGGRLDMGANINSDSRLSSVDASLRHDGDNFYIRGRARADLIGDDHSIDVWGGYKPTDDIEIGVRGGYSRESGGRVGIGATWSF